MLLTRLPRPALRPFVKRIWVSLPAAGTQPGAREHVLPTGDMHFALRLSGPALRLFPGDADAQGEAIGHAVASMPRGRCSGCPPASWPGGTRRCKTWGAAKLDSSWNSWPRRAARSSSWICWKTCWRHGCRRSDLAQQAGYSDQAHFTFSGESHDRPRTLPLPACEQRGAGHSFLPQAFGVTELFRLTEPSGRIGHAELDFNGATLMLSDEFPEYGIRGADKYEGTSVTLHIHVDNADAVIDRAIQAGAALLVAPQDQFYGERSGTVRDPFGHHWNNGHSIEDVAPEEMQRRYDELLESQ